MGHRRRRKGYSTGGDEWSTGNRRADEWAPGENKNIRYVCRRGGIANPLLVACLGCLLAWDALPSLQKKQDRARRYGILRSRL